MSASEPCDGIGERYGCPECIGTGNAPPVDEDDWRDGVEPGAAHVEGGPDDGFSLDGWGHVPDRGNERDEEGWFS